MRSATLSTYRDKRNFRRTPEPAGTARRSSRGHSFVVQKHAARRLHYDFRLELDGVLKSWAVPKGPSPKPGEKRLAVHVEDHPLEYAKFKGVIPEGEYGAGNVEIWDRGTWIPESDPHEGLERGRLKFRLEGKKLRGAWALVRMRPRDGHRNGKENWLLIKERDDAERSELTKAAPTSRDTASARRDEVAGTRKGTLPAFVAPQLATLVDRPPTASDWVHEVKFDGYRILARLESGRARLLTRNNKDWTERFANLAAAVSRLRAHSALFDGEIVALDEKGVSTFQVLQEALSRGRTDDLVFYVFDLLYLDGKDLRDAPLTGRKALLAKLLTSTGKTLRYSDHVKGQGEAFFDRACRMGLEGIISKQADAPYRSGRGSAWLKVKCVSSQEFVIAGFTKPKGTRAGFGALLLGVHDGSGALAYVGRVGTGFDQRLLKSLHAELQALERPTSPFARIPAGAVARDIHWVAPALVAEVSFSNWTRDGILRQPVFKGLREDKPAKDVVREQPTSPAPAAVGAGRRRVARIPEASDGGTVAGVPLTHPDRVLYPGQGITKRDLAAFYEEIADWILPHVAERPLSLVRCPEGRDKACFYQKHAGPGAPDLLKRVDVREKGAVRTYLYVDDLPGLISLVQMGVLELHPWGSRVGDLAHPDRLTLDLDPSPGVPWRKMVETARQLRGLLDELHLKSFVKTTGGKGLHVVVPFAPEESWEAVRRFAKAVGEAMVRHTPRDYTVNPSKAARKGKIFIDYLRNAQGATAVAAYSTRALDGAPVSTPIAWDELGPDLRSDHYTIENLPRRLASLKKDPWEGYLKTRQTLPDLPKGSPRRSTE